MSLRKKIPDTANWIHPVRSFTLGIPGPVGPYGENGCECCGLYLDNPETDILCSDCEIECVGKPWCPYENENENENESL